MTLSTNASCYADLPFSLETPQEGYYQFMCISDCLLKCTEDCENIRKCRAIGILYSECGRYYLKDLEEELHIRISVKYLSTLIKSTIIPYPVQMFGELQWKKKPVIFVQILQTLKVSTALRLVKSIQMITENHLPHSRPWCDDDT